ncbi:hypothetical protein NDU88_002143 [Pleurodeles waltl]|uniref:Uncharacterized protein n=1 Tax=Pleurodeles waltl TaxID=8319 RepID=A0AAV7QAU0_PLEWA|nr:hypothetical protein NDU88_002143 [Pleurodeles waltl]
MESRSLDDATHGDVMSRRQCVADSPRYDGAGYQSNAGKQNMSRPTQLRGNTWFAAADLVVCKQSSREILKVHFSGVSINRSAWIPLFPSLETLQASSISLTT